MTRMLVVACVLASASVVIAQQTPTFQTRVDGVRIDVLVTDGGAPVTGLTKDDFEVRDDGVVQEIDAAESAGRISAVIALDTSFSVLDRDKISDLRKAGLSLLDAFQPQDHVSLITFSEDIRLRAPWSAERAVLRQVLIGLDVKKRKMDQTVIWDALFAGASLVVGGPGRPAISC